MVIDNELYVTLSLLLMPDFGRHVVSSAVSTDAHMNGRLPQIVSRIGLVRATCRRHHSSGTGHQPAVDGLGTGACIERV